MPKGKPIDSALKSEIVSKIRNDGMTVSSASAHYGVNSKSIYYWLRDGVVDGNRNLILENNKLKNSSKSPTASLAGLRPSLSAQKASRPG